MHTPVAEVHDSYYGIPPLGGTSLDFLAAHAYSPASVGHGRTVANVGLSVEATGPEGPVVLTHGDSADEVVLRGVGDFDGDGRPDMMVDLYESGSDTATYIVRGTLGPGTHDPSAVGVRVRGPQVDGGLAPFPAPVGDQDRDGADDVSFGPVLYSGRQLTAARAGAALPAPIRTLASPYVGLLQLDPNGPPVFVEPDPATASLEVLDARSDRLLIGTERTDLTRAMANGARAVAWLVNGHRIVEFGYTTRSGSTTWRWDLDAVCVT